jgi:hypothetical protein
MNRAKSALIKRMPDRAFIYLYFLLRKKELLNLRNPKRFTHKIQWLKLNGNLERLAKYADKYAVREFVTDRIGGQFLVQLIGVYEKLEDIPFSGLPEQFVIKATHGCEFNFICRNKSEIDYRKLKSRINHWLEQNFYYAEREPQYRDIRPRLMVEHLLQDGSDGLIDYKFYCSHGEPQLIQVDTDRFVGHKSELKNLDWGRYPAAQVKNFDLVGDRVKKPKELPQMIEIARKLAQGFAFVRVDLYLVKGKIYFGELTFTPGSGLIEFTDVQGDQALGKLIDIGAYK